MKLDKKTRNILKDILFLIEKRRLDDNSFQIREFIIARGFSEADATEITSTVMLKLEKPYKPEESGSKIIFKKKYKLKAYTTWDEEIFKSAKKFYKNFRIYPNILTTLESTLRKIDIIANLSTRRENIKNSMGNGPGDDFAYLQEFISDDFSLDFYLDFDLQDKEYYLIFDSKPDPDGGEEIKLNEDDYDFSDLNEEDEKVA